MMKIFTVALVLLLVTGSQGAAIPTAISLEEDSTEWQTPLRDLGEIGTEIVDVAWDKLSSFTLFRTFAAKLTGPGSDWRAFVFILMPLSELASQLKQEFFIVQHISDKLDVLQSILTTAGKDLHEELGSEVYAEIHDQLVSIHENIKQFRSNETQHHHL